MTTKSTPRPYDAAPREGERTGAAGWCTACGRAWMPAADPKRCAHCGVADDQEAESEDLMREVADLGLPVVSITNCESALCEECGGPLMRVVDSDEQGRPMIRLKPHNHEED